MRGAGRTAPGTDAPRSPQPLGARSLPLRPPPQPRSLAKLAPPATRAAASLRPEPIRSEEPRGEAPPPPRGEGTPLTRLRSRRPGPGGGTDGRPGPGHARRLREPGRGARGGAAPSRAASLGPGPPPGNRAAACARQRGKASGGRVPGSAARLPREGRLATRHEKGKCPARLLFVPRSEIPNAAAALEGHLQSRLPPFRTLHRK